MNFDFLKNIFSSRPKQAVEAKSAPVAVAAKAGMAAVIALGVPLVAGFEGLKLKSYLDQAGIWTICYGETLGVKPGDTATPEQCETMLEARFIYFAGEVALAAEQPLETPTWAALTSFTYNVGVANLKSSTLLKKLKAGDVRGACEQLPLWNKVRQNGKLVVLKGLTKRREVEKQLCLQGV